MSIRDYLSDDQIDKIHSVIRTQCDRMARNEAVERNRIGADLYNKLTKARGAHKETGDIYVALFYPENAIDGLEIVTVANGIYTQPELKNEDVVIHIYHKTNPLNSKLVKDRAVGQKPFFCIRYDVDSTYRLKSIEAVHVATKEKEVLYEAPRLFKAVG